MNKINVAKSKEAKFSCPYCGVEIIEIEEIPVKGGFITEHSVYVCPKCRKPLPISSRTYAF
ncbi:MAG TPA: hypothetical protein VJB17_03320 [Patescibacteria group bacterium]|nr:hypothetical protein [Patescibacteria group bacterium]